MAGSLISGKDSENGIRQVKVDTEGRLEMSPDSSIAVAGPITGLGTEFIPRALGPFAVTTGTTYVAVSQTLAAAVSVFSDLNNDDAVTIKIDDNPVAAIYPGMSKGFSFGVEATMDLQDFTLVAGSGTQTISLVYWYPV